MLTGADKIKMQVWLLLSLVVLSSAGNLLVSTHMIPEDRLARERHGNATAHPRAASLGSNPPSVEILGKQQDMLSERKKKAPPPDCVPVWGSCKSPTSGCCNACSFCRCRLFKTICYCRMGKPRTVGCHVGTVLLHVRTLGEFDAQLVQVGGGYLLVQLEGGKEGDGGGRKTALDLRNIYKNT
ncbi:hypothetical protein CRUP_025994 [Coryphaenoides rupestris]|nr:hypothetical protein CRUP_025994 [Coryphaenoides rupestris]